MAFHNCKEEEVVCDDLLKAQLSINMGCQKHTMENSAVKILQKPSNKQELTGFSQRFKDWLRILGAALCHEVHSSGSVKPKAQNDGNINFKQYILGSDFHLF